MAMVAPAPATSRQRLAPLRPRGHLGGSLLAPAGYRQPPHPGLAEQPDCELARAAGAHNDGMAGGELA